jgi:protein SPT2
MSSFTALMALSASKTQEQNNLVERAKEERRKKELLLQKQQAERDAKEREMEKRLRMKHFEDEKREEERRKRREEAEKAREAAMQRKKDEQRDVLLYGPKKAASSRTPSSSQASNGGSKERRKGPDVNDDDSPSGPVLTREELRERRQQAEMRRLYSSTRRSTAVHSYSKAGRRLPGGAVDITTTPQNPDTLSGKGVRDRIAALPNTLTKLNTVKRDTRTIDEIRTDLQKKKEGKVLDGDEAKSFDDWFSTKKKEPIKKPHTSSSVGSDSNSQSSSELSFLTGAEYGTQLLIAPV